MAQIIRIGTRESQLAVWQANTVKELLAQHGFPAELVYIKSEGDLDLKTPLYEMGVQGIFTRSLDLALLNNTIDIAVHSMKDVPTQLPKGILQAAVLKRGSVADLLVFHPDLEIGKAKTVVDNISIEVKRGRDKHSSFRMPLWDDMALNEFVTIATSSIRRKAQWLNRFPDDRIEVLRGNVNTRLKKLQESKWHGAIFAAAGLERINLRPENSIELDWMLPAPAQGAIMVVCRQEDSYALDACVHFNDADTDFCTKIERDFLRALMGGCSTPISAYAEMKEDEVHFKGNILSIDGKQKAEFEITMPVWEAADLGSYAAEQILNHGGQAIADSIRHGSK